MEISNLVSLSPDLGSNGKEWKLAAADKDVCKEEKLDDQKQCTSNKTNKCAHAKIEQSEKKWRIL
jgi:hypothetical protein